MSRVLLRAGVVLLLLMFAWQASAADRIGRLSKKLLEGSDFRIRTQAALALGKSGSSRAVAPLCKGLGDKRATVRAAAAAGLGKLQRGGKKCLKRRLSRETKSNVKKMIRKALRLLDEAASGPALGPSSRYYISMARLDNKSGRTDATKLVRKGLLRAANGYRGYVFAPANEPAALAKKRLRKRPQVIGFRFSPTLRIDRGGGRVAVRLILQIKSYPDNASMGRIMRGAGQSGVNGDDKGVEDQLIERVCRETMQEFNALAAQLD